MLIRLAVLSFLLAISECQRVIQIPTAKTCTIGQQWVANFIKFYCYHKNTVGITKGVRAIGCVPSNNLNGTVLQNGEKHSDQFFMYTCTKTFDKEGSIYNFQAINCFDGEGRPMNPGESRTLKDGSKYKCYVDQAGDVRLSVDGSSKGCYDNGELHAVRSAWLRNREKKVEVKKGVSVLIGSGSAVACEQYENGTFYSKEYGCVTPENKRVDVDQFGLVNNEHVVKCVKQKDGHLELELVNDGVVSCQVDGKRLVVGTEWDSKDKKERYRCDYGKIVKIGCLVTSEFIPVHEFKYIKGVGYQCEEAMNKGFVHFGDLKGCKLKNGTVVQFFQEWNTDDQVLLCRYRIDNQVATSFVQQVACRYKQQTVSPLTIMAVGKEVVKCDLQGSEYVIRKLSDLEMKEWQEKQAVLVAVKKEIPAHEGEGKGQKLWTSSTTTTTTPRPTPIPIKACKDFLASEHCKILSPICGNSTVEELKTLAGTLKLEQKNEKKLSDIIHLMEQSDSANAFSAQTPSETVSSLFGLAKHRQEQCVLPVSPCDRCVEVRNSLRNLVQTFCPSTCKSCQKGEQMNHLAHEIVSFFTKNCYESRNL